MNRRTWIAFAAALVVGSMIAFLQMGQNASATAVRGTSLTPPLARTAGTQEAPAGEAAKPQAVRDFSLGDENAALEIIEYASFTCPHCRRFHEEVFPKLKAEYIDAGKVKFTLREVYFDPYGLWAGMLARCGGGEKYFPIVDMIFRKQSEWTRGDGPAAVAENLRKIGRLAGLPDEEIDACLQDEAKARAMVAAYQANATRDGINGTPTFIIGGEKVPNMAWPDLKEIIDRKLAEAGGN